MSPCEPVMHRRDCSSSAHPAHTPHARNMSTVRYCAIVILCYLINIHGENWYSAVTEQQQFNRDKNSNSDEKHNIDDKESFISQTSAAVKGTFENEAKHKKFDGNTLHRYSNNQTQTKKQLRSPDFYGSSNSYTISDDYLEPLKNNSWKPVEFIKYNNTITVINVVKKLKPKRKITNRRCPNRPARQHLKMVNQTARSKFLEVLEVVEFQHVACVSSSGLEGICLHEYECGTSGGTSMGTCADEYGTCCVTQFLCDGQSSAPAGWFTNPGFPTPSSERLSCTFTLNKASADIKQIRLDFVTLELLGPTDGTCQQDQFVVSGQNINSIIPILCGINTGQHVYVEVGDTEGPIYMSVQTISSESRLFSTKVTQLSSADDLAAPTGCLQYFTEPQGFLESFNYRDRSEIGIARAPSYFNNLNYAMCMRRATDSCSVTYTNADYMQIVNYDTDGLPVIPQGQAGVEIFNCPGDWLLASAIRLCGDRLNDGAVLQDFSLDAPVTDSNAGPIAVWFRTDEGYVGRGFKLQYQQNLCNSPP